MSRAMSPTSTASIPVLAIRPAADAFRAPMDICSQKRQRRPARDKGQDPLATEAIHPRWTDNPGTRARWADGGGFHPSLAIGSIQNGRPDVYYGCISFALGACSMFGDVKHSEILRAMAASHQICAMRYEA